MERKEALEVVRKNMPTDRSLPVYEALQTLIPELRESEDERMCKRCIELLRKVSAYSGEEYLGVEIADCIIGLQALMKKQKEKFEDISTVLLVKKEIERRIETWQKSRQEALAMECNTLADDAAVRIEELYNLISFLGTIRCSTNEKQKEHQFCPDAPKEKSVGGDFLSSHKDKNLDEIAQDYVEGVKEYNPEPTWDLIQTAVCYGYHYREEEEQKEQKPAEWDEYTKTNLDRALQIIKKAKGTLQGYQSDDGIYECDKAIECLEHFLYRGLEIEKFAEIAPNQFDGITYGMQGHSIDKPEDRFEEAREKYQVEWKLPEDFEEAVYKVANFISPFDSQDELRRVSHRFAEQLMSLAKKELAEKPAEWSEEEKQKLNRIYEILGYAADDKGFLTSKRIIGDKEAIELQDFLKSIRPHWKPSEEQIHAIIEALKYLPNNKDEWRILNTLVDVFKKLM